MLCIQPFRHADVQYNTEPFWHADVQRDAEPFWHANVQRDAEPFWHADVQRAGPYAGFLKGGFADPNVAANHCSIWPHNHHRERVQERGVPLPITAFHKFGEGIGNSAWFFIIFIFIIIV